MILPAFTAFLLSCVSATSAQEMTGLEIMDEVADRHELPAEASVFGLSLVSANGRVQQRTLERFALKDETGLFQYLLSFSAPAGIDGVALLSHESDQGPDDQWTYLPSIGRARRIAGGGRRKSFLGTDYAYEDLTREDRACHSYSRLGSEGNKAEEGLIAIEATPSCSDEIAESGYRTRVHFIHPETFFIMRTEYYGRETGALVKTFDVLETSAVNGTSALRASTSVMTTVATGHSTRSTLISVSADAELVSKEMFTTRYLERGRHRR